MLNAGMSWLILLRRLAFSKLTAVATFAMAALPDLLAIVGLAIAFFSRLTLDFATATAGFGPRWYPALWVQLTGAVVLCLLVAAGFGRP